MKDLEFIKAKDGDCACTSDKISCRGFKDYLTKEEEEILSKMRALREKGVMIRQELNELAPLEHQMDDPSIELKKKNLQKALESIRKEWKDLEILRKEANHRKMVMLGHEDP